MAKLKLKKSKRKSHCSVQRLQDYNAQQTTVEQLRHGTLSILFPTSIVMMSCFVECVSSSLIHWSSFINDCLLDTSYTVKHISSAWKWYFH